MTQPICKVEGCERVARSNQMCEPHYHADYRDARSPHLKRCERCSKPFRGFTSKQRFCCRSCAQFSRDNTGRGVRRTELGDALSDGSPELIISVIRSWSKVNDDGCWVWQKSKSVGGYPTYRYAGKSRMTHRLVLELTLGRPIDGQDAHHKCGNALCVNPAHIQLASRRQNIAEMLTRRTLVARINQLEQALAEIDPDHPALDRVADLQFVEP